MSGRTLLLYFFFFANFQRCSLVFPLITSNLVPRLYHLPPLSVREETLVGPGHVLTQNLGGKKYILAGWGSRVFVSVAMTNLLRVEILCKLKTTRFTAVRSRILADEE